MADLLPWFQIGSIVLSALVVWLASTGRLGFAAGRFVQKAEGDSAALQRQLDDLRRDVDEKASLTRVAKLEEKLDGEHVLRRDQIATLDKHLWQLAERVGRHDERFEATRARMDALDARVK